MELSPRIVGRIARDFPDRAAQVAEILASLELPGRRSPDGEERICAAVLIVADGDPDRLLDAAGQAERDWRDVLVRAGLEHDDWRERLARALESTPDARHPARQPEGS